MPTVVVLFLLCIICIQETSEIGGFDPKVLETAIAIRHGDFSQTHLGASAVLVRETRADYPLHKLLCKAWADPALAPKTVVQSGQFGVNPNEAPEGRRTIYFHAGESRPRMTLHPRTILRGWPREIISLLGDGKGGHEFTHIEMKVTNGERLPYTLEIISVGTPKKDNLSANAGVVRAIQTVASETPDAAQTADAVPWRGPILMRRVAHPSHHRHSYPEDMTLADFRNAILFMAQHTESGLTEDASLDLPRSVDMKTVKGVKLLCASALGYSNFAEQAVVPVNHDACTGGDMSPVSVIVGMSVRLWKFPDTENYRSREGGSTNQNAEILMSQPNSDPHNFGLITTKWQADHGNVLVVRDDGQDLDEGDVRTLVDYAREHIFAETKNVVKHLDKSDEEKATGLCLSIMSKMNKNQFQSSSKH